MQFKISDMPEKTLVHPLPTYHHLINLNNHI